MPVDVDDDDKDEIDGAEDGELSFEEARKLLAPYRKSCWAPVCEDGDGDALDSKFSGVPYLTSARDWPACEVCESPQPFLLQLNLTEIGKQTGSKFGEGLLQLFYCQHRQPADQENATIRVIALKGKPSQAPSTSAASFSTAKRIVSWRRLDDDYPDSSDVYSFEDELECDIHDLADVCDTRKELSPHRGDKLRGWPAWAQGSDFHPCRFCGEQMEPLMQLDSNCNLSIEFGSNGTAVIQQCPLHAGQVRFDWSC